MHGFEDQVEHGAFLEKVVEFDNVGAGFELGEDGDFVQEGGGVFFVEFGAVDAFDGVFFGGGAFVDAGFYGGEGSLTELWDGNIILYEGERGIIVRMDGLYG